MISKEKISGYLAESRVNLDKSFYALADIARMYPEMYYQHYPGWYGLYNRQRQLEYLSYQMKQPKNLGLWPIVLVIGAAVTGLSALGLWAFKQQQDTKKQTDYLTCVDNMMKNGLPPQEAANVCGRGIQPAGLDLQGTIKTVIMTSVGLFALYLVVKLWK